MPGLKKSKQNSRRDGLARDLSIIDAVQNALVKPKAPRRSGNIIQRSVVASKKRGRPRKVTVEDEEESEDEIVIRGRPAKQPRTSKFEIRKAINALREAKSALKVLDDLELSEDWLEDASLEQRQEIHNLHSSCNELLSQFAPQDKLQLAYKQGAESSGSFGIHYTLKSPGGVTSLLVQIDSFKGNGLYNLRKVFGGIRTRGDLNPLTYSFSGWNTCADPHPRLLESETWTPLVKQLATAHNYPFRRSPNDVWHGVEDGTTYASHCEPKLLVYFACSIYQKRFGNIQSIINPVGDLWRLKNMEEKVQAELILSVKPCLDCLRYINWYKEYMGIQVAVIIAPNSAKLIPFKNKQKYKSWSITRPELFDLETEDEEEEDEDKDGNIGVNEESETTWNPSIEVVLRSSRSSSTKVSSSSAALHSSQISPVSPTPHTGIQKPSPRSPGLPTRAARITSHKHKKPRVSPSIATQLAQFRFNSNANATKSPSTSHTRTKVTALIDTIVISSDNEDEAEYTPTRNPSKSTKSYKPPQSSISSTSRQQATQHSEPRHYSHSLKTPTPPKRPTRKNTPLTPSPSPYSQSSFDNLDSLKRQRKKARMEAKEAAKLLSS